MRESVLWRGDSQSRDERANRISRSTDKKVVGAGARVRWVWSLSSAARRLDNFGRSLKQPVTGSLWCPGAAVWRTVGRE